MDRSTRTEISSYKISENNSANKKKLMWEVLYNVIYLKNYELFKNFLINRELFLPKKSQTIREFSNLPQTIFLLKKLWIMLHFS